MPLSQQAKQELVEQYGHHKSDVGSTEVQVALLTSRIAELTEHLKTHKKDFSSHRGLLKLVSRRRRLLQYLKDGSPDRYKELIQRLGLRR